MDGPKVGTTSNGTSNMLIYVLGEGLGKNGDGRAQPIRVKIKRDYGGVSVRAPPHEKKSQLFWTLMHVIAVRWTGPEVKY